MVELEPEEFSAELDEALKRLQAGTTKNEAWDSGYRTGLETASAMVLMLLVQRRLRALLKEAR